MAICDSLAGRFTALQRSYGLVRFRQGSQSGVLSTPRWWGMNPRTPTFTRPVFLLTGRQTTGAAEQFVLALRTLSQVTVLGDTTAGSMGSSFSWDLGNGWTYTVSRFLWLTPEQAVIERVGLAPAVYIRATPADFARHTDPVLDSAIARASRVSAN
jgi:carboxyl-terminal processing protease